MFWVTAIIIAIFVAPTILGIITTLKGISMAKNEDSGVDWWTLGALTDIHNKHQDGKK